MTIGLICAIPQELAHLCDFPIRHRGEQAVHTRFDTGTIDGHDVVLTGSGMGKVDAAIVRVPGVDPPDPRDCGVVPLAGSRVPQSLRRPPDRILRMVLDRFGLAGTCRLTYC